MSLELVPIPIERVEETRNLWGPFVAEIAKHGRCHLEQKLADVYSGNVALILVWDTERKQPLALVGWSLRLRGEDRVAILTWLTGEHREEWIELYDALEQWFQARGFRSIVPLCRPGWAPFLKKKGYRLTHVEYEKDI